MAQASGAQLLTGMVQESTWGTAASCNTTGLAFRTLGGVQWKDNREDVADTSLNGSPVDRESTLLGPFKGAYSYEMDVKHQGMGLHTGLMFGASGTPAAVTSYYGHTQTIRTIMTGRHATIGMYDGENYEQLVSCRPDDLELSAAFGDECVRLKTAGKYRLRQTNTSPNTSLSSMTETTPTRVQPTGGSVTYQIIAQGGTLAAIEIKAWNVKISAPYPAEYSSTGQHLMRESVRGKVSITGSIEFPAVETAFAAYKIAAITPGTNYALKLAHILTSGQTEWHLILPSVKFLSADAAAKDKGQVPLKLDFVANLAVTTTTGTTAATTPYLYMVNSDSAAYVA